jgi:hypothetical protein
MGSLRDALILLAFGLVGTFFFGRPLVRALRGRKWATTRGKVTAAQLETTSGNVNGVGRRAHLRVAYAYTVDGAEHAGERATFFNGTFVFRTEMAATAALHRYAKGAAVTVHYDPQDPADAVLDPAIEWGRWALVGFCVAFTALVLVGLTRMALHAAAQG